MHGKIAGTAIIKIGEIVKCAEDMHLRLEIPAGFLVLWLMSLRESRITTTSLQPQ